MASFVVKCDRQRKNGHVRNLSMGKFVGRSKVECCVWLTLNGSASVSFQIDTGFSANTCHCRMTSGQQKITAGYPRCDRSKRRALGFVRLKVEHKGSKHEVNLVITDQEETPLLDLKSSQGMGLERIIVPGVDIPVNNVVAFPKKESTGFFKCRKGSSTIAFC